MHALATRIPEQRDVIRARIAALGQPSYSALARLAFEAMARDEEYGVPDASKMTVLDHGDYQGTKIFITPEGGYQPATYYVMRVSYGSCSACDTLQRIRDDMEPWDYDGPPTDRQLDAYYTLVLHLAQSLVELGWQS